MFGDNVHVVLELMTFIVDRFYAYMLSLTRIGAFVTFFPLTGGEVMKGLWVTRTLFVMGLTLFIFPVVDNQLPSADMEFSLPFAILLLKEMLLGYLIAYLFSPILWIADALGGFIDGQRGTGQENAQDSFTDEQTTPLGLGIIQTTVILILTSGGLLIYFGFIFDTFVFWPPFSFVPAFTNPEMLTLFITRLAVTVELTLVLAAPVVIATFLTDWSLGLLNRFAQQMNVYVLAMSIKSAVALAVLVVYGGIMFTVLLKAVYTTPVFINEIVTIFGKGILKW